MHDDDDRPGPWRGGASREDSRRWGYDPAEDPQRSRGHRGLGRDDEPPIDAERDPGRARHLATGEGGGGDWSASAAGIGQRRGPVDPRRPFHVDDDATARAERGDRHVRDDRPPTDRFGGEHYGDERDGDERRGGGRPGHAHDDERHHGEPGHACGRSHGGWSDAGAAQRRGSGEGPRGDDVHDVRGWRAPSPTVRRPGPKGWQRSDERIRDDACERLSRSGLDAGDVSVDVREGHVTLSGTVADRPTKHAIESLVDACHGVREIDNRIKVMRPGPPRHDAPPEPRAWVPQDSPTARDEARGRVTRLPRDGSGYYG